MDKSTTDLILQKSKDVSRELKAVKTDAFIEKYISLSIQYGYSMDTQPQKEEEKEEEETKEEEEKDMPSDFF